MKKLILFLISCSAIANLAALEWYSPVILPTREVLIGRLHAAGFDHLEEKTKLSERLTCVGLDGATVRPLSLSEVTFTVKEALDDYNKYLNNPMMARRIALRKPKLFEIILQDVPGAVAAIDKDRAECLREDTDRK